MKLRQRSRWHHEALDYKVQVNAYGTPHFFPLNVSLTVKALYTTLDCLLRTTTLTLQYIYPQGLRIQQTMSTFSKVIARPTPVKGDQKKGGSTLSDPNAAHPSHGLWKFDTAPVFNQMVSACFTY